MLNHSRYKLPILHNSPEHLRNSLLSKHTILLPFYWQADVDRAALRCRDLGVERIF